MHKDDAKLRVRWEQANGLTAVEEAAGSSWVDVQEQISDEYVRARLPATVLSQKQIFALAERREFLLDLIDRTPDVNRAEWERRFESVRQRFMALRAQARQLEPDLKNRPNVEADLRETERKLKAFELSHHAVNLKEYQRAQRQLATQKSLLGKWKSDLGSIQEATNNPNLFSGVAFDGFDQNDAMDAEFLAVADEMGHALRAGYAEVRQALVQLAVLVESVQTRFESLPLHGRIEAAKRAYTDLIQQLQAQGVDSPEQYGVLVAKRQELQTKLSSLDALRAEQQEYDRQADQASTELTTLRKEITQRRSDFIARINSTVNDRIRLTLRPYGSAKEAEAAFRDRIRQPVAFPAEIFEVVEGGVARGLLARLFPPNVPMSEGDLDGLKQEIASMRHEPGRHTDLLGEAVHGKLRQHLESKLSEQDVDELLAWFPGDGLDLAFKQQGGGWRSVDSASAGQKSAAVLALLLSFGSEPLIVDQPEDDLDNAMVMELVVAQVRQNKARRQLIIVTHNPNVVVNGDAEWVIPKVFRGGQIDVDTDGLGAVAERGTRKAICRIMEGGERALRMRYKKMLEELGSA